MSGHNEKAHPMTKLTNTQFAHAKKKGLLKRLGDGWVYKEHAKQRGPVRCVKTGRLIAWVGRFH